MAPRWKHTSEEERKRIIKLYLQGKSYRAIEKETGRCLRTCINVVKDYERNHIVKTQRKSSQRPRKTTQTVLQFIEYQKWKKPSIYCKEIRQKLLDSQICTLDNVPSVKSISRVLKKELNFSHKKLTVVPTETLRPGHEQRVDTFLSTLLNYDFTQMHFFDEASIVATSGNRSYGHSHTIKRAIEVQQYASSVTLTVNVCCDFFGINHFNILNGASNALEMIEFFNEALAEKNEIGNPMFKRGDVVIMDNCGFHHQRQGERLLRELLANHGVDLVFQPPYCPEYNVTECVFGLMRQHLQRNEKFVSQFTELAIVNALDHSVLKHYMPSFFKRCGYT